MWGQLTSYLKEKKYWKQETYLTVYSKIVPNGSHIWNALKRKTEIPDKSMDLVEWSEESLSKHATAPDPINKKINKFGHLFGKNKFIQKKV